MLKIPREERLHGCRSPRCHDNSRARDSSTGEHLLPEPEKGSRLLRLWCSVIFTSWHSLNPFYPPIWFGFSYFLWCWRERFSLSIPFTRLKVEMARWSWKSDGSEKTWKVTFAARGVACTCAVSTKSRRNQASTKWVQNFRVFCVFVNVWWCYTGCNLENQGRQVQKYIKVDNL